MPGVITQSWPALSHYAPATPGDLALLDMLVSSPIEPLSSSGGKTDRYRRRDAPLDPLLLAAAVLSGPHITRHHYHHATAPPDAHSLLDDHLPPSLTHAAKDKPPKYTSQQAPRRERLKVLVDKENTVPSPPRPSRPPASSTRSPVASRKTPVIPAATPATTSAIVKPSRPELRVQCMARTRIPTPHGPAFLHLYHNTWDAKEHLAIVIDPVQLSSDPEAHPSAVLSIRSRSLDAVWSEDETEMDRITRGAYVGRLSAESMVASAPSNSGSRVAEPSICTTAEVPAPLIRIHSECFTGETIGSMRCDCGEQLDEAMRLISQPITLTPSNTIPGRGVIVYLRQEGRGIGLLSKLRAYNLQDLGHDTVTANLLLGYGADERGYEIAGAILRDLGLAGPGPAQSISTDLAAGSTSSVRVLTNNPDKIHALEAEGVRVIERVTMIPRSWRCLQDDHVHPGPHSTMSSTSTTEAGEVEEEAAAKKRAAGATLIGASAAHGEELEKYLRTKVLRMGHMLPLPDSL